MIRTAVLCAIVCYPFAAWDQTSSAASVVQGSSAQGMSRSIDYGMPERLGRQVAPTPSAPWSIPDLREYTSLLKLR